MLALTKILAGGVVASALFAAAPAAAQYYPGGGYSTGVTIGVGTPGYGYGYSNGYQNGYGYSDNFGYGVNQQAMVSQCTAAVQARLAGAGGYGYGYSYGGRVLGISRVEPRGNGGLTVRGVASSTGSSRPDLTFRCRTDGSGYITSVDVQNATSAYGNSPYGDAPYGNAPYVTQPYGYAAPYGAPNYNSGPYGYTRF